MAAVAPSTSCRAIVGLMRLLLRAFFRRVEVTGQRHLPQTRGVLLVSHGLFRYPILGPLLRRIGTVPIRRAIDGGAGTEEERRAANRQAVDALADRVAHGAVSALFPEGDSHDASDVQRLETGAAHLYSRARELTPPGSNPPVILPVGLHARETGRAIAVRITRGRRRLAIARLQRQRSVLHDELLALVAAAPDPPAPSPE